jgi:hypothetical protein
MKHTDDLFEGFQMDMLVGAEFSPEYVALLAKLADDEKKYDALKAGRAAVQERAL